MMNVSEIDAILNKILSSTDTSLRKVQNAKCPHHMDLKLTRVFTYIYDGQDYRSNNLLFRVDNLEFIKKCRELVKYKGSLSSIISSKKLSPFILFINGEMINIKNINLITDSRYTYLEVLHYGNINFKLGSDTPITILNDTTFILPKVNNAVADNMILEIKPSTIESIVINGVVVPNNEIIPKEMLNTDGINTVEVLKDTKVSNIIFRNTTDVNLHNIDISSYNCIVFPDGYDIIYDKSQITSYTVFIFSSGMSIPIDNTLSSELDYNNIVGFNIDNSLKLDIYSGTSLDGDFIEIPHDFNYKIYPDTLIVFNDGYITTDIKNYHVNLFKPNCDDFFYKAFFYKDNKSLDNITKYTNLINYIELVKENIVPNHLSKIADPLDFVFTSEISKVDRIYDLVKTICLYNSELLQEYIDSKSNIEVKHFTSDQIKDLSDYDINTSKYVYSMYLKPDGKNECRVIVFKNGLLHDTNNIVLDYNYINIEFDELLDGEYIDIMIFYRVNNSDIPLDINANNDEYLISNYIPFKDIVLLTNDIHDHIYKHIPISESLQYEIDNNIKDLGKGYVKIDVPEYYDGRKVYLSSRRKFVHEKYIVSGDEYSINDLYKILLPDTFKYCTNRKQFMMFRNGRKINNSDAYICLNNKKLPFDKRFIHMTKKCDIGDEIDIFYIPEEMVEVFNSDIIDERGYIEVDKNEIGYNLDGRNSSIFINGRRISDYNIESVSTKKIRLTDNNESLKNISVVKHITYNDDIFEIMRTLDSVWDEMVSGLSDIELDELFNFTTILTDIEEDIRLNSFPKEMVLYEIIRRYWLVNSHKVKVENPLFDIYEHEDILVYPINSSLEMIDVVGLIYKYFLDESIIKTHGGTDAVVIDALNEFMEYDKLDIPEYVEYYQDGVITIPNNSDLESIDISNIIDLVLNNITPDMIKNYGGVDAIPIDALLEYVIEFTDGYGLPIYNSIDASIIRPYFYEKLITMDIGDIIHPIPIDSKMDQIEDLPLLYIE